MAWFPSGVPLFRTCFRDTFDMKQKDSTVYAVILPFVLSSIGFYGCSCPSKPTPAPVNQFPSPMSDSICSHERIDNSMPSGTTIKVKDVLSKPVEVFIPLQAQISSKVDLLIHFHGVGYVPAHAVSALKPAPLIIIPCSETSAG